MKKVYENIWNRAKEYLQNRYDTLHTQVATQYAERLLQAEGGDEDIIIPAIILHDTGWSQVPKDVWKKSFGKGRDKSFWTLHEKLSEQTARKILTEIIYSVDKIGDICEIIEGHDTQEPDDFNGKLVRDADKLWRYSGVGFYHQPDMSKREIGKQQFKWAEENIERWFYTETAKEIARQELELRKKECKLAE